MPFSFAYMWSIMPGLLRGVVITISVTIAGMFFANVLGLVVAIMRRLGWRPIKMILEIYVAIMRNIPFIVFCLYMYFSLPTLGIKFDAFPLGVLILCLYFGAFLAEVYRGGMETVGRGEWDAGRVLNLSEWQILRLVVLPQAIRISIPSVMNYVIGGFKDSSYLAWITLQELMWNARQPAGVSFRFFEGMFAASAIYFIISYPSSLAARAVQRRMQQGQQVYVPQ